MSIVHHKKGRPSRAERLQIRKDLEPYFERRIPAHKAAQMTAYNTKTVNNYYDQFYREIHGYETKNFVERYEKEKIRFAILLENLIYEEYDMLDEIKASMQKFKDNGDPISPHLINCHSKIIRTISQLGEKRASALMRPDAGDQVDIAIEEKVAKYV